MSTEVALSEYIDGNTETGDALYEQDESNKMKPESTQNETQNEQGKKEKTEIKPGSTPEPAYNENPIQEDVNHEQELKNVMQNLYYTYYEHTIDGPFEPKDILTQYITSKIKDEIWIKRADNMDELKWVSIKLKATSTEQKEKENEDNKKFKETFPELYHYLMPKLKLKEMKRVKAPLDVPEEAVKKLSIGRRAIKWCGYVLLVSASLVTGLHMLPTMCVGGCLWLISAQLHNFWVLVCSLIVLSLGLIIVPFIVVYAVLLDGFYYEIQSWMIGYIAWGICSFLFMLPVPLRIILSSDNVSDHRRISGRMFDIFLAAEFWILGVSFGSISIRGLMRGSWHMIIMLVFIFPPIVALLPSFIIGFIANFALEEKFELQCSDDYADSGSNLCYNDGSGCCEVISSHDIWNAYTFVGGLASNILATWAVIRICGFLLVDSSDEASVYAKRNE